MMYLIPYLLLTVVLAAIFTDKFNFFKAFLILAFTGIAIGLVILVCIPGDNETRFLFRCKGCRWLSPENHRWCPKCGHDHGLPKQGPTCS